MRFESLDGALCLVASVVAGGDQFELYLLLVDVLFESIRCFVVQCVLFYSESCNSHPVDYFSYALIISSFVRLCIGSTNM